MTMFSPSGKSAIALTITVPLEVNLTAFPTRFINICRNRKGSPAS